jgi:protein TonB
VSDIFLSYASADRPRVKPLVDVLRQQGWSVWWDRTILPGKTWDQVIEAALADARCVIVLWSRDSVQSDWVRTEADEARRRGILVPALLDDVNIPLAFRRIQAANLADWSGVLPSAGFDQLAQAVSDVLSSAKAEKAEKADPARTEWEPPVREAETKREPPHLAVTESADRSHLFDVPEEGTFRKRVIIFGLPALALIGIMIYALTPSKQASSELPLISTPRGGAKEDVLPPPPSAEPAAKVVDKVIPRQFDSGKQVQPKAISEEIDATRKAQRPSVGARRASDGEPGGAAGLPSASGPPKAESSKPVVPQRIRVGGAVQTANLIKKVSPAYPELAKDARIQGQVRFTAIIGKDGTIQDLQLVSGHPLLAPAATEAVKQWMYKPTLMNGEPVEVITQIDVNFTLSQ